MKHFILFVVMIGWAGTVWADEFSDFRVPSNRVSRMGLFGGINYWREMYRSPNVGEYNKRVELQSYQSLNNIWRRETDRNDYELRFAGRLSENLSSYESRDVSESIDGDSYGERNYESDITEVRSELRFSPYINWYPLSDKWGGAINGNMFAAFQDQTRTSEVRELSTWASDTNMYWGIETGDAKTWGQHYQVNLEIGPVIGRVRNATAVADALVLQDRLINAGVLSGKLSQETLRELANLLYKESNYYYKFERYDKFFWQDIETLLTQDSVFVGPLTSYAVNQIQESYVGMITREIGWQFRPYLSYSHTNSIDHQWSKNHDEWRNNEGMVDVDDWESYNRQHSHTDFGQPGLRGDYRRPFGTRWQFYGWSIIEYYRSAWSHSHPNEQETLFANAGSELYWIIADRWLSSAQMDLSYWDSRYTGGISSKSNELREQFSLEVTYYVENRIGISLIYQDRFNWRNERRTYPTRTDLFEHDYRTAHLWLDVSYSLSGAFQRYFSF